MKAELRDIFGLFQVCKRRTASSTISLCVKRHSPWEKQISRLSSHFGLKKSQYVLVVSDCPSETMNALAQEVELLLGRWGASQRSSPEHCTQPWTGTKRSNRSHVASYLGKAREQESARSARPGVSTRRWDLAEWRLKQEPRSWAAGATGKTRGTSLRWTPEGGDLYGLSFLFCTVNWFH